MKNKQELDEMYKLLLVQLRQVQSYSEFERSLDEYLAECYSWENLAASTEGLRLLPTTGISLDYLFQFFSEYLNVRFRDGSRMSDFKFIIYIEVFSHLPDELPEMNYEDRVELSVWLFRFLSIEGCQWMFFEMYDDLEETRLSRDWHFMLQGRKGKLPCK